MILVFCRVVTAEEAIKSFVKKTVTLGNREQIEFIKYIKQKRVKKDRTGLDDWTYHPSEHL